jgi:hypothetical protein
VLVEHTAFILRDMRPKKNAMAGQEEEIYRYNVTSLWVAKSLCRPIRELLMGPTK